MASIVTNFSLKGLTFISNFNKHVMKTVKTLFIALLVVAISPMATAQTADEIIANYFENTGGVDAWNAIVSIKSQGKADFGGQIFPFIQTIMKDGRMAIQIDLQGQTFVPQAFDGEKQWGTNFQSMKPEASDDETSTNYKRNEALEFPDPFLDYAKKGYSVELLGEETVEGVETYKIKLTKNPILVDGAEEDLFVTYYFDKENFVPIMQEATLPSGPQKGTAVQTLFSDYQELGDIYFPYTIAVKFNGQVAQSISIETMEVNSEIDDALFKMPETEAVVEKKE